jgi:pimeloyl-ACP methyl ester carboxylesterase
VVMGAEDSDFADSEAEATAIVGLLPTGLGRYEMIAKAGHYPHAEYPQEVADALLPFLAERDHSY